MSVWLFYMTIKGQNLKQYDSTGNPYLQFVVNAVLYEFALLSYFENLEEIIENISIHQILYANI